MAECNQCNVKLQLQFSHAGKFVIHLKIYKTIHDLR